VPGEWLLAKTNCHANRATPRAPQVGVQYATSSISGFHMDNK